MADKRMVWVQCPEGTWHWRILTKFPKLLKFVPVRPYVKGEPSHKVTEVPERVVVSRIRGCLVYTRTKIGRDRVIYSPEEPGRMEPLCPDCKAVYAEWLLKYHR